MRNGIIITLTILVGIIATIILIDYNQPGTIQSFIAEQSKFLPRVQGEEILKSSITKKKICKILITEIKENYRHIGTPNRAYGSVPLDASIRNYESVAAYFKCRKALHQILMDAENGS